MTEMKGLTYPRLAHNELVEIKGERYRAEWWSNKTYEFIYVGSNGKPDFIKGQKEVSLAIESGIIKDNIN